MPVACFRTEHLRDSDVDDIKSAESSEGAPARLAAFCRVRLPFVRRERRFVCCLLFVDFLGAVMALELEGAARMLSRLLRHLLLPEARKGPELLSFPDSSTPSVSPTPLSSCPFALSLPRFRAPQLEKS
eukprot:m.255937 g.255937  ORF g.255937 m.255937 type:complete len:129 (+) comp54547_c0_seq2:958-1344(+)